MRIWSLFLILLALGLAGCSRVAATTALNPDGSYTRTVTYTINDGLSNTSGPIGSPQKEVSFHSIFALPDKDPSYKMTQKAGKEGERQLIVSKNVAVGDPAPQDIQLLSNFGKPLVTSRVSVQKLANGDLEYDEFVSWVGPKPATDPEGIAGMTKILRPKLPVRLRADPKVEHLAFRLAQDILRSLFGPPNPTFAEALANPDFMKLQIEGNLETIYRQDLKQEFPDMSENEIAASLGWFEEFDASNMKEMNLNSHATPHSSQSQDNSLTPMLFVVTYPGKVVETDGLTNVRGKVYWSMSSSSPQFSPVRLHLIVNPTP